MDICFGCRCGSKLSKLQHVEVRRGDWSVMVVPSSEAYRPLRAPELRWLCTQRGLSPYGFKQDLVARLDEQDRQGVESSSECIAAGLEPFRELEELASQYAANPNNLSPVSVNPRVAATPKTAAKAKEPPQTKATPEPAVEATPSAMAPAQAKMPPMPMPMPQPGPAKPLTEDERALRGLLEFFACSDVKGQSKLFAVKYREFVRTVFDFFQSDTVSGMTGTPTSRASTAAAAAVSAAAATTDAILRGNIAEAPDGAANPNETWSAEMWQKCQEVIATHLEVRVKGSTSFNVFQHLSTSFNIFQHLSTDLKKVTRNCSAVCSL